MEEEAQKGEAVIVHKPVVDMLLILHTELKRLRDIRIHVRNSKIYKFVDTTCINRTTFIISAKILKHGYHLSYVKNGIYTSNLFCMDMTYYLIFHYQDNLGLLKCFRDIIENFYDVENDDHSDYAKFI